MLGRFFVHRAVCFLVSPLKHGPCLHQHLTDKLRSQRKAIDTRAPLCRMLLSVCMKDYVARSYGHTPRKLPLKGVPLRATSRFIAYQALLLYTMKSDLSIGFSKNNVKYSRIFDYQIVHITQCNQF